MCEVRTRERKRKESHWSHELRGLATERAERGSQRRRLLTPPPTSTSRFFVTSSSSPTSCLICKVEPTESAFCLPASSDSMATFVNANNHMMVTELSASTFRKMSNVPGAKMVVAAVQPEAEVSHRVRNKNIKRRDFGFRDPQPNTSHTSLLPFSLAGRHRPGP